MEIWKALTDEAIDTLLIRELAIVRDDAIAMGKVMSDQKHYKELKKAAETVAAYYLSDEDFKKWKKGEWV